MFLEGMEDINIMDNIGIGNGRFVAEYWRVIDVKGRRAQRITFWKPIHAFDDLDTAKSLCCYFNKTHKWRVYDRNTRSVVFEMGSES